MHDRNITRPMAATTSALGAAPRRDSIFPPEATLRDQTVLAPLPPAGSLLPPHSLEMEAGLLGCCLSSPEENLPKCIARFAGENVFYDLRHKTVFEVMTWLFQQQRPVDTVTVYQTLKEKNLSQEMDLATLTELTDSIPSAAAVDYYLEATLDFHYRRLALRELAGLRQRVQDCGCDTRSVLLESRDSLDKLGQLAALGSKPRLLSHRRPEEILSLELPQDDCLLGDRLLAKGQSLTILGTGGIGKSRLLLQLAISSIIGRNFAGLPTSCAGSRWLILQTENSNRRLQMDLAGFRAWAGEDWSRVNDCLVLHTLETEEDGMINLDNPDASNRLGELIAAFRPQVVCFDPLKDFTYGDLNRDADMAQVCQRMSRLVKAGDPDRALVVLHHALTGKAGVSRVVGWDRTSFGRNSKMLQAWTRAQINVAPARPNHNELLILSCGKCSNGREFEPFAVQLNLETMIYEPVPGFDLGAWQKELEEGTAPERGVSIETVAELCAEPMTRRELAARLQAQADISQASAYRWIQSAIESGHLTYDSKTRTYSRNFPF